MEHCTAPISLDADFVAPMPVYALPILTESFIADFGFLKERAACHFHSAESGRKVPRTHRVISHLIPAFSASGG